jgi:hypothetical protein
MYLLRLEVVSEITELKNSDSLSYLPSWISYPQLFLYVCVCVYVCACLCVCDMQDPLMNQT